MIYQSLARYARLTPHAPAIVHIDGLQTSYLQAFQFLNALMVVLRTECPGIEGQQPVGLACKSGRLHMLLMFALEALGITSMNFVDPIDPGIAQTVATCGLFIGERRPENARAFLQLDQGFFDKVTLLAGKVTAQPASWDPDKPIRIATTSGSTGKAKTIPMSYATAVTRVTRRATHYGFDASSRYLLATAMTGPIVQGVEGLFSVGGAVVFLNPERLSEHLAMATHVTLLPVHLSEMLGVLPEGYAPLTGLKIFCTGAALGSVLRQAASTRLNASILCPFSSNESGWLAFIDADGVGTILEGVEIEIVDDRYQPVANGVEGRVRIRSPEMVSGYLDPDLIAAHFVDGWFLPGDLGVKPEHGRIRFTGRAQTLLNFGGIKYSPELIEEVLSQVAMADDLAVCARANAEAIEELQIAVVNSSLDDRALAENLRSCLGPNFMAIQFFRVSAIPRNSGGKVQRQRLSDALKTARGIRAAG